MMRIFLDANVLFSAAYSAGAIRRLIDDLHSADHTVVADRYVIEEALRNLEIHRPASVSIFHTLTTSMTIVPISLWSEEIPLDFHLPEKDIPVLASAIAAGCDILTTGDTHHFGAHYGRTIASVTIRSPVDAARTLFGHDHKRQ